MDNGEIILAEREMANEKRCAFIIAARLFKIASERCLNHDDFELPSDLFDGLKQSEIDGILREHTVTYDKGMRASLFLDVLARKVLGNVK